MQKQWPSAARAAGLSGLLLSWLAASVAQPELDFTTPHCGKKFRIVTHEVRPFINVDVSRCVQQKCPPEAFGEDGGLTYKFMMNDVLRFLKQFCEEEGKTADIDFDWYIAPTEDKSSATRAVEMACLGQFDSEGLDRVEMPNPCPSAIGTTYSGPSPAGDCNTAYGDSTCVSPGPDIVVGAVHILRERLDMLDFTTPYMSVEQIVVKRPENLFSLSPSRILTVFQPFTPLLWGAILAEIGIVWILILLVEGGHLMQILIGAAGDGHEQHQEEEKPKKRKRKPGQSLRNVALAGGVHAFYDALFWSLGSAFDPGGPGKSPTTVAGRFLLIGHWFFLVIIAATYTGAVGPFLADSSDFSVINGLDSLKGGEFTTAVRGPIWNSDLEDPLYLGEWLGGNSGAADLPSMQFKLLQSIMSRDLSAHFKMYTVNNMDTFVGTSVVDPKTGVDACTLEGLNVKLGAYDMVKCKGGDDKTHPESLIFDAPSAIYQLRMRYEASNSSTFADCKLVTAGDRFYPTGLGLGFPKNTTMSIPFSRAIELARASGVIQKYLKEYKIRDEDNPCHEVIDQGGIVLTVALLSGLFVIVAALLIISLFMGFLFRFIWPVFCAHLDEDARNQIAEAEEAQAEEEEEEEVVEEVSTMSLLNQLFENSSNVETMAEQIAESMDNKQEHPNPHVVSNSFNQTLESNGNDTGNGANGEGKEGGAHADVKASSELVFAGGDK